MERSWIDTIQLLGLDVQLAIVAVMWVLVAATDLLQVGAGEHAPPVRVREPDPAPPPGGLCATGGQRPVAAAGVAPQPLTTRWIMGGH